MHPSKTTHGHPTAAGSSVTSPNANNTDHHQTPPNYTWVAFLAWWLRGVLLEPQQLCLCKPGSCRLPSRWWVINKEVGVSSQHRYHSQGDRKLWKQAPEHVLTADGHKSNKTLAAHTTEPFTSDKVETTNKCMLSLTAHVWSAIHL